MSVPRTPATAGELWDMHAELSPECIRPRMTFFGPARTPAEKATGMGCVNCDFRTEFDAPEEES